MMMAFEHLEDLHIHPAPRPSSVGLDQGGHHCIPCSHETEDTRRCDEQIRLLLSLEAVLREPTAIESSPW
jgi:hypothetical protein